MDSSTALEEHTSSGRNTLESKLAALHSHAVELNTAKTLQEIYECTINAMVETFKYERVDILRVQGSKFVQVAKYGGIPAGVELPLD